MRIIEVHMDKTILAEYADMKEEVKDLRKPLILLCLLKKYPYGGI